MISEALSRAANKIKERNWDTLYIAVDIHETILKPTYSNQNIEESEFYDNSKLCLSYMSARDDIKLILYTCCSKSKVQEYLRFFESKGIYFDYVNENPEVQNTHYADFSKKFYRNLTLDDTAGFNPEVDFMKLYSNLRLNFKTFKNGSK